MSRRLVQIGIVGLLMMSVALCVPSMTYARPPGKNWHLVFDSEFQGNVIDRSQWAILNGWANNNVVSRPKNCFLDGHGHLVLTLGRGTGCQLASARYDGAGSNSYGIRVGDYVEARIWFPGPGIMPTPEISNWPAFWAVGLHWPVGGEIDIAEATGGLSIDYHSGTLNEDTGVVPGNWGNSWHTYAVYREVGTDGLYYDGQLVRTISTHDSGHPESIMLTSGATGPTSPQDYCCGGPVNPEARMLVDWVRAWRQ